MGTEDAVLAAGERFGAYYIEAAIGEGGMGHVYRATHTDGREVALKLIRSSLVSDDQLRRRFEREARAAAKVEHPNVVRVLFAEAEGAQPYIVQEFVRGGSLAERIEGEGLGIEASVRICRETASALDALHAAGLVHRDVKPPNILLDETDRVRLGDFGLAKDRSASVLTKPGQTLGSMDYMAPEQIRGDEVSATADVYSLGCVVYECLTGHPPFGHLQGMRTLWAHLQDDPPDPCETRTDAGPGLGWAVLQALRKEPRLRPQSAGELARMVQTAAPGVAS